MAQFGAYYVQQIHPMVTHIEAYFTGYLIAELLVRWGYAIYTHAHAKWFFFPIIRIYEVLAILPELRFLRLIRVGIIAYELKQHKIRLWPLNLEKNVVFYYHVFMEALTDQIVLTALQQVEREFDLNSSYQQRIHALIDEHRSQFANTLGQVLQHEVATALQQQQADIVRGVGLVVHQAIADTPQIHQLLKLMPFVGGRIEHLIQGMGQTLGENITAGLVMQFSQAPQSDPHYQLIASKVSQVHLQQPHIHELVASVVQSSLSLIREQIAGNSTLKQQYADTAKQTDK